jgi:hypothetical protein
VPSELRIEVKPWLLALPDHESPGSFPSDAPYTAAVVTGLTLVSPMSVATEYRRDDPSAGWAAMRYGAVRPATLNEYAPLSLVVVVSCFAGTDESFRVSVWGEAPAATPETTGVDEDDEGPLAPQPASTRPSARALQHRADDRKFIRTSPRAACAAARHGVRAAGTRPSRLASRPVITCRSIMGQSKTNTNGVSKTRAGARARS